MHRKYTTVTGVAVSNPVMVDSNLAPFNIGFGVTILSGTASYTVEHTFDDLRDTTITPTWFPHPFVAAQTANKDGNYAMPITAYRLNVTVSSGGSVRMVSLQGAKV